MVVQFIIPCIGTHGKKGGEVSRARTRGGRGRGGGELLEIAGAVAIVAMIIGIIGMWYEVHWVWFLYKVTIITLCRYYTCSFSFA